VVEINEMIKEVVHLKIVLVGDIFNEFFWG
jgi:hypothetical protein